MIKKKINITIDILTIIFFIWIMICLRFNLFNCDADGWSTGIKAFKYFTNWSILFLSISSLLNILVFFKVNIPSKVRYISRLIAVTCTTITLFITYSVLAVIEIDGWMLCFSFPTFIFEHTILPLFGFIQLFVLDDKINLKKIDGLLPSIPVFLYGIIWVIVLLILNLPKEVELDLSVVPYPFLAIHNQPIYLTIIYMILTIVIPSLIGNLYIYIINKILSKRKAS